MSKDFIFNKFISFEDLELKTNLRRVVVDDIYWITDDKNNTARTYTKNNDVDFDRVVFYGGRDPSVVMNTLISVFNIKYIDDDDLNALYHDESLDINDLFKDSF